MAIKTKMGTPISKGSKTIMRSEQAIIAAVEALNTSEFAVTGIKVELEAQLNRGNDDDYTDCNECSGSGQYSCDSCDAEGYTLDDDGRRVDCIECEGGYNTCQDCDGEGNVSNDWSDESCEEYILDRLTNEDKQHIVYSQFYNDRSVDSEFTFTISTRDPRAVLVLPKVVRAFNDLANEIGNGCDVRGAGMHMALLNSEGAVYPSSSRNSGNNRYFNFQSSMTMLLPALFFLGTPGGETRRMDYRCPRVSNNDKYSAIAYRNGSLEFRVFDTCYDNPDAILDNVVVMSRAMRFWRRKPVAIKPPITNMRFGNNDSHELQRLFVTTEHVTILAYGLQLLKPKYYTIRDLRKQRQFGLTAQKLKADDRKREREYAVSYKEYEERFNWQMRRWQMSYLGQLIEQKALAEHVPSADFDKLRAVCEIEADTEVKARMQRDKVPFNNYLRDQRNSFNSNIGSFTLAV